ncbi:MAG: thioredoxin domain-containing protein [Planctomycetaceae bacterium]|nr:thioredoxin domain-containing protein [Planctomycetaceae bacterium]
MEHGGDIDRTHGDVLPPEGAASQSPNGVGFLLLIVVPSLLAAVGSGYLLATSLTAAGRPLGCGAGSGCDEVLASRWSHVLGAPVGLPAVLLYLSVAVAAVVRRRTSDARLRSRLSAFLWIAAGTIVTAVSWFVGLQAVELQVFCPWCLADHALGLATAVYILVTEFRLSSFRPGRFLVGMGLSVLLAGVQIALPGTGPQAASLATAQVKLLEGQLRLDLEEVPTVGSPSADGLVVLLFDYCCPHCRQTHTQLLDLQRRHPDRLRLVLLPVPLNADCNPAIDETEPRFQDACELARLALAVWRSDRVRFADFDTWLFESPTPRPVDEALAEAELLVGRAPLQAALADGWVDARITADVEAYAASGVDAIPVLLAPGKGGVSGRAGDEQVLQERLEQDLGISLR